MQTSWRTGGGYRGKIIKGLDRARNDDRFRGLAFTEFLRPSNAPDSEVLGEVGATLLGEFTRMVVDALSKK